MDSRWPVSTVSTVGSQTVLCRPDVLEWHLGKRSVHERRLQTADTGKQSSALLSGALLVLNQSINCNAIGTSMRQFFLIINVARP